MLIWTSGWLMIVSIVPEVRCAGENRVEPHGAPEAGGVVGQGDFAEDGAWGDRSASLAKWRSKRFLSEPDTRGAWEAGGEGGVRGRSCGVGEHTDGRWVAKADVSINSDEMRAAPCCHFFTPGSQLARGPKDVRAEFWPWKDPFCSSRRSDVVPPRPILRAGGHPRDQRAQRLPGARGRERVQMPRLGGPVRLGTGKVNLPTLHPRPHAPNYKP